MKVNYQKELDKLLSQLEQEHRVPTLFLHSCCAPCSSYVLEYLSSYFQITVFYYNPNIDSKEEYQLRVKEQRRLIEALPVKHPITFLDGGYEPKRFYDAVKGLEREPEGGARCKVCFELRLNEAAREASARGFDYFTTTLSISPLKDAQLLNEIGQDIAKQYHISYLPSDFKKKDGYKRSTLLSKEYHLYRQNYCGCIFSKRQAEATADMHSKHSDDIFANV